MERWTPQVGRCPVCYWRRVRNSSRKNAEAEPKQTNKQTKNTQLWMWLVMEINSNAVNNSIASVQLSSVTQSCPTVCDPMNCSMPDLPVHHKLPEFTQTHAHRWCHPAISSSAVSFSSCPIIPPSIRVFTQESTLHMRWPKYWSFSFSISPPNEHTGLISFRMDWFDLLAVQGTLKSLLQHQSSKASTFRHSAFFTV